jgi:hypothetical protein
MARTVEALSAFQSRTNIFVHLFFPPYSSNYYFELLCAFTDSALPFNNPYQAVVMFRGTPETFLGLSREALKPSR